MAPPENQHLAWLARSFGRPDYLPLTPEDLAVLAACAEPTLFRDGSHLFRQGERATAAYVIRDGEVDLYRIVAGQRRMVARVGSGSVIGDIAMFRSSDYLSSARAAGEVRALRFLREVLLPELARHPAICLRWLVAGLEQLEKAQRRIINLMHRSVLAQVADLLADEAEKRHQLLLSQGDIATLLGVSRQSVNEAIATLRSKGLVETGYRRVVVIDREALKELASSL